MQLDQVPIGTRVIIEAIGGDPAVMQRLLEFGLLEGEMLEVIAQAPMGDPLEIRIGRTRLSLRRAEAAGIRVRLIDAS